MVIRALFLKKFGKLVGLIILLVISASSWAQVFKCVDEATGQITYTDKDCPDKTLGNYQSLGSTNIDTDSASLNEAGTKALRNGAKPKGNQTWVNRARDVGAQPKTEAAKTTQHPPRDTQWFERRMCQKRGDGNCHLKYPVPK